MLLQNLTIILCRWRRQIPPKRG